MITTKPKNVSYLRRKATTQEWRTDKKVTSLRVNVITWNDDQTMDIKVVEGDGRTKNFKVFVDEKNVTQKRVDQLIKKYIK
jgi:hypothetical protein